MKLKIKTQFDLTVWNFGFVLDLHDLYLGIGLGCVTIRLWFGDVIVPGWRNVEAQRK